MNPIGKMVKYFPLQIQYIPSIYGNKTKDNKIGL